MAKQCFHPHFKTTTQYFRRCREESCHVCSVGDRPIITIFTCLGCGYEWIPAHESMTGRPFIEVRK